MSDVLPTTDEKPRFVAEMFGRIARRYDLLNTLMTAGQDAQWRHVVAQAVGPVRDVLDVGTGTGKLALAVAQANPSARVVGVDFAYPMLAVAARNRVRVALADALHLPFADASFDGVVSAFVVRNLADVQAGLIEQRRVLRPGGRLVILETTPGWSWNVLKPVIPVLGGLIAGDARAYTYLPESVISFQRPEDLAEMLDHLGFHATSVRRLALGSVGLVSATR